jgi:parvulin-like peptidyl-prolyl isomerase
MKRIIKRKLSLTVLFSIAYCVFFIGYSYAEDKIIAIVNQEVITQKDLSDFAGFMRMQLSSQFKGKELDEKMQGAASDMINRLIDDRLILQEAKKNNIPVEDSRVNARIEQVKKEYQTDTEFQNDLMRQGLTQADVEKKIREQFLSFGIIDKMVRSKITIKPDEVTDFYEKNKKEFNMGPGIEFLAISLDSEDLANTVAYQLRSGSKIEDLALRFPLTVNNFTTDSSMELNHEIKDVVSKLGINEVSSPLAIQGKYYIFRVISISAAKDLTLEQAQVRVTAILFEKKMQEGLSKWLKEIKNGSYIKIM